MLKLICKSSFIILRIITSGTEKKGLLITQGKTVRGHGKTHSNNAFWFDKEDISSLRRHAASFIRGALDRDFYRPPKQDALFKIEEISSNLLDVEDESEDPLLLEAHGIALNLPTTIKWKQALGASNMLCNLCGEQLDEREIIFYGIAATPNGQILHVQCQECKTAAGRIAKFKPREQPEPNANTDAA